MKNHHKNSVQPSPNSRGVIHETIATRAYELWEQSGRPENQADDLWLEAEQELVTGRKESKFQPTPLAVSF